MSSSDAATGPERVAPQVEETVCAVVVTHNRRDLLVRCLDALLSQARPPEEILVVDSASTDGTRELVRHRYEPHPRIHLLALEENLGGAGGFHQGMASASKRGHDWLWLMDDDTIPEPDCLEQLLRGAHRPAAPPPILLASQVLWRDGSHHPHNLAGPRWRSPGELALSAREGLVLLRDATFVSIAIRREAVERYGLPLADYFIWVDDIEYTNRILRTERGYLVPESRVWHWTKAPQTAAADTSGRFYYHVRNLLHFLLRGDLAPEERFGFGRWWVGSIRDYLRRNRWSNEAFALVARGVRDGLRRAAS